MSRRYGGKYSPDGPTGPSIKVNLKPSERIAVLGDEFYWRRQRQKTWILLAATAPLVPAAFNALAAGSVFRMIAIGGALTLIAHGTHMIRKGLEIERAYATKTVATPPRLPRKLLGSIEIGTAAALASIAGFNEVGMLGGIALGVLSAGLSAFTFGKDPSELKGDIQAAGITHEALEEALSEARQEIAEVESAAAQLKDASLAAHLRNMATKGREIVAQIEADPKDLRPARKFLKVYLTGASDAASKYVQQQDSIDPQMEWKFRSLLKDMEDTFEAQHIKLKQNEYTDLDVEIEVLADRLKAERLT